MIPALVGHFQGMPISLHDTVIDAVLSCQRAGVDPGNVDAVRRICAPDRGFGRVTHLAGV